MRFQELHISAGCGRAWRSPSTRQLWTLLPAQAVLLERGCTTQAQWFDNSTGGCSPLPPVCCGCACRELDVQPNPPLRAKTLVPLSSQPSPRMQGSPLVVSSAARTVPKHPGNRYHQVPRQQLRHAGCRVCLGQALQYCVLQVLSHCCDPLSGLGTIPLPGVDVGGPAAYLLQVENHSLQDGVEGLPAALPSGCCRGGESSSDISLRTEPGEKPPPQPLAALPRPTSPHPRDGQHARPVPAHLSPCRPRGWQMVLLAGGPCCLPGPALCCAVLCCAPPAPPLRSCLAACAPLHHCLRARARRQGSAACQVMLALKAAASNHI